MPFFLKSASVLRGITAGSCISVMPCGPVSPILAVRSFEPPARLFELAGMYNNGSCGISAPASLALSLRGLLLLIESPGIYRVCGIKKSLLRVAGIASLLLRFVTWVGFILWILIHLVSPFIRSGRFKQP